MLLDKLKPKASNTQNDKQQVIHLNDIDKKELPENIKQLVKEVQTKDKEENKTTLTLYNLRNLCLNSLIFGDEFKDVLKTDKKYAIKFTAPINEIYYDAYGKLYHDIENYLNTCYQKYNINFEIIRSDNNNIIYVNDHIHINNNDEYIIASSIEYIIIILKQYNFIENKDIHVIDKNYSNLNNKYIKNNFKINKYGQLIMNINTSNCVSCRFNNICSTTNKTTNK